VGKLKAVKWKIGDVILMGILVVLAVDLLYLYYSGAWYDPYTFIEIAEIVLLYSFTIFGILRIIHILRELKKHLSY
jgi:hypothetical protein